MKRERITEGSPWNDPRGQVMKTPDDVAEMMRLRACGWGVKRIARQLGCSHHTVKDYVAAGGVKPFKSPERPKRLDGLEGWLRERLIRHRGDADVVRQDLLAEKGVAVRLWLGRRRCHHLDFRALQPIRHMPRSGNPRRRDGPGERDQEGPPARRHLAVALDFQSTNYCRRMPNPSQSHLDQIARTLHRCWQAPDDGLLKRRQCAGSRMADVRQINSSAPGLVERGGDGRRHSRQPLNRLELAHLDVRKRGADGFLEDVEIDRLKKAASKPRGKLAHGHDLHAGFVAACGMYPNHVTGEDRMNDHRSAHLHLLTKSPRLWCASG
ncbi:hypothetical protein ACVWW6_000399 [Bradyrhizobium sp. USDA 3311]